MSDFDVNSVFYKNGWDAGRKDAADEIERLRELLSEAEEQVGDLIDDAAAGDPKDRVWILVPLVEWDEKDKRIEGLEKESEWKAMKQLLCADYHIIPTDEIRAAWEYAHSLVPGSEVRISVLYALRQLGIERCEGCGGSGEAEQEVCIGEHFVSHEMAVDAGMPEAEGSHHGYEYGSEVVRCPGCNGRRWVKK